MFQFSRLHYGAMFFWFREACAEAKRESLP
jgi:hypothetical protein